MVRDRFNAFPFLERAVPVLVLAVLIVFTYVKFFRIPYAGFRYSSTGEIVQLFDEAAADNELALGDRLIQVGPVSWSEFEANPRQTLFEGVQAGDRVSLQIERNGQIINMEEWTFPGWTSNELIERVNAEWWLAYVFWVAGLATILLIRPRDVRWATLSAFNFLTAVWLITGGIAVSHNWYILLVFRSAIWLSVPVYLHLHWNFPEPLARVPARLSAIILRIGYITAAGLAIIEWVFPLPGSAYGLGFFLALAGSLLFLVIRLLFRPKQRRELGLLGVGLLLAFIPPIGISLADVLGISLPAFIQGGAFLALPAIPGVYFYALYRRQLGQLESKADRLVRFYFFWVVLGTLLVIALSFVVSRFEHFEATLLPGIAGLIVAAVIAITGFVPFLFLATLAGAYGAIPATSIRMGFRANQLLAPYLFLILMGAAFAAVSVVAEAQFNFPGAVFLIGTGIALIAGVVTVSGYGPFRRLIERRLLDIPLPPAHLLESYATRITANLDRKSLVQLLTGELLPSLLIRQSALIYLKEETGGSQAFVTVYVGGVDADALPEIEDLDGLISQSDSYRPYLPSDGRPQPCPWAYVVLPLYSGGKLFGLWLLGHRDPDDLYSQREVATLRTLADQTAVALSNVLQAENLQLLYEANIERHEAERARLAWELHDEVLHQLGILNMSVDERSAAPQFQGTYQRLKTSLRHMITGLRPAMLMYGLALGLEELVDALNERADEGTVCRLNLQTSEVRYAPHVEQHLFRIVQQAAENALRHAGARTVEISGSLSPESAELLVSDDGRGLGNDDSLNLSELLAHKHYGLVNMHERARLIDARLQIDSMPGQGVQVAVMWTAGEG